jgi:demethylmenaquinone methyltransferase/2-methoxy-6-polyprenyl-1,4-benzoquinol methylase
MNRVLKQGGTMMILEFSQPQANLFSQLYRIYSERIIPFIGKLISKHKHAYQYLPESVAAFPAGKDFLEILKEAGLKNNREYSLTGGIATIYMGDK